MPPPGSVTWKRDRRCRKARSGNFFWNAGIFCWKAGTFLGEARRSQPEIARFIEEFPKADVNAYILEKFPALPKISVDYAIMEKAEKVAVAEARFDWDDVGSWTALPAHLPLDAHNNTVQGAVAVHDSRGNIVIARKRLIALCGVSDLIVVETEDAILVCHRDAAEQIKQLQPHLPDAVR
jgi:mannose-1-phosphate guanylyltransferase